MLTLLASYRKKTQSHYRKKIIIKFCLTKWVFNDQLILKALLSQEVSSTLVNLEFDDISIEKALEILWNPWYLSIIISHQHTIRQHIRSPILPHHNHGWALSSIQFGFSLILSWLNIQCGEFSNLSHFQVRIPMVLWLNNDTLSANIPSDNSHAYFRLFVQLLDTIPTLRLCTSTLPNVFPYLTQFSLILIRHYSL